MTPRRNVGLLLAGLGAAISLALGLAEGHKWNGVWEVSHDPSVMPRIREAYGQLPLSFEANQGQTDPQVRFLSRGSGYSLFLTATGATLALNQPGPRAGAEISPGNPLPHRELATSPPKAGVRSVAVRMQLVDSNPHAAVTGLDMLPGKINYMIGNDPARWRTAISTYAKVAYSDVYPDVDLVYYGNQRELEYDFVVRPGGDPAAIVVNFEGADSVTLDVNGDLVLQTTTGELRHRKPFIYQETDGVRQVIEGGFRLTGTHEVRFALEGYDTDRPLIIDPVLDYATYLGGSGGESGNGIAVDSSGNAYVTGYTPSVNFPTTVGTFDTTSNGSHDVFITKLNSAGSALVYSTYLGGSGTEFGTGGIAVAVDTTGAAYVTGHTTSTNFPTTPGAFDTTSNGDGDAFVTKLNPAGSLLDYSTYLGGSNSDQGYGIAVDTSGAAYVTGHTASTDFPTTPGAFDTTANGSYYDAFVTKLNPAGSALDYSTSLGGSVNDVGHAIAIDTSGSAYVTGYTQSANFPTTPGALDTTFNSCCFYEAFVTKLDLAGAALVYSTYLGGSNDERGYAIAVDASGAAYVTGYTRSTNFPTTPGAFDTTLGDVYDAFIAKLNSAGSALDYSTYLGGGDGDIGYGIAVSTDGAAFIAGYTFSVDFPITSGALDTTWNLSQDGFVTKLNPAGSAVDYSTYLGGSDSDFGYGISVDISGAAYVTGATSSGNFPTTSGAFDTAFNGGSTDAFVVKIAFVQDQDGDGIDEGNDNCASQANPDQADNDADGEGDACDADDDDDTVPDTGDNCPLTVNPGQEDNDGDAQGDVCDLDDDNDGVPDTSDNCAVTANRGQHDYDGDGPGDVCDADDDNDGVVDGSDAFPLDEGEYVDTDNDGVGNNADLDDDGDGVADTADAFPLNPSETVDTDNDGTGNNADLDDDGDGVPDAVDNCRLTPNPDQRDTDADGIGDACDAQIGPPTSKDQCKDGGWALFNNPSFRNQGQCVSAVTSRRP